MVKCAFVFHTLTLYNFTIDTVCFLFPLCAFCFYWICWQKCMVEIKSTQWKQNAHGENETNAFSFFTYCPLCLLHHTFVFNKSTWWKNESTRWKAKAQSENICFSSCTFVFHFAISFFVYYALSNFTMCTVRFLFSPCTFCFYLIYWQNCMVEIKSTRWKQKVHGENEMNALSFFVFIVQK